MEAVGIRWQKDLEAAVAEARSSNRQVLLEFFSPTCGGCRAVGAFTLTDALVVETIDEHCAAVQIDVSDERNRELVDHYRPGWTPDFRVLDSSGADLARMNGYLPPSEFVPHLLAAVGQAQLRSQQHAAAAKRYDDLLERFPSSTAAPEARYYRAVAGYKATGDRNELMEHWGRLQHDHPDSMWRVKQSFIEAR